MSKEEPKKIDGYELKMPNKQAALTSLSRITNNDADHIWEDICAEANIQSNTENIDELCAIYKLMAQKEGKLGIVGRSLSTRATSYRVLSRLNEIK